MDTFEHALALLKTEVCEETLDNIGVSRSTLLGLFLTSVLVLLVLIMFVIVGILAFRIGSTFSSIVNSCMVVGSGLGVGGKDKTDGVQDGDVDKEVESVLENMQPDT
jgi:uncharacterized membrane protein